MTRKWTETSQEPTVFFCMVLQRLSLASLVLVVSLMRIQPINAATYTVTSSFDVGAGSLRQAMLDANANAGLDSIHFNIPQAPAFTPSAPVRLW